ncbi:MAG: phage portal protein [Lachnospiraceae bacterium]|nr:phage portal protein [Lachnospiraceae bacterium]
MRSYQDLLRAGQGDKARGDFCRNAVNEFKSSVEYKQAADGEAYYHKHNKVIEGYQKFIYTVTGRRIRDTISANYKLKTLFFRRLVIQQVQYVLGNGIKLIDGEKDKLGKRFDHQLKKAAKMAMSGGRAFGFWNVDHLEVFGYADTSAHPGFCPLYDEETSELMAGIRYWFDKVGDKEKFTCTLYEIDGATKFLQLSGEDIKVIEEKQSYVETVIENTSDGVPIVTSSNYKKLPIVPLYSNDSHESELVGIKECIDCYDLIKSGLANNIDDSSEFYWILKNSGGMDDVDLAKFIYRLKTVRAAVVDTDDNEGSGADANTLSIPTEAREKALEILRNDIYEDFQALDTKTLSAAAKTTQEIQSAYQSQDNKCADFEDYIIDFVDKILDIAGIEGTPSFTWNRVVNQSEQTSMILSAASYLSDQCVISHLPFLTPEEIESEIAKRNSEQLDQFHNDPVNGDD